MSVNFLIRGDERLHQREGFKLVGRAQELKRISAILMRSRENSVLLVGPGGVGCTALCLGLQALKADPNAPFDIVSKRMFWLDADNLFQSGDTAEINAMFQRALDILYRTPDSILIIEDFRDFIEAARNNGSLHFINALILAVARNKTQVILEARDDDLDIVLKCHSNLREYFTLLDLEEPINWALREIVNDSARALAAFHGIKIADDAISAAIELTNKYRTRDLGLSRAQPARSVTLLDRAMATYRLSAHEKTDSGRVEKIRTYYRLQREAEVSIIELEQDVAERQAQADERHKASAPDDGPGNSRIAMFAGMAGRAGFETKEISELKQRIADLRDVEQENKNRFDALADEINAGLELTRDLVLSEFSQISGIAVSKLNENERAKLARLSVGLSQRIFGQERIVAQVADGIKVARLGRRNRDKPLAFLFLGPSGVGKTEMAKAIASLLLDDERALTRFDMSEYMEKHAVAKMIGAPPGYEGFEAGGILTNAMRKNPNRVLLFDEIEKAHPDVFNIFLQILSDGRLTDNVGRTVSFSDATVIMTTNIGQAHFLDAGLAFEEAEAAAVAELGMTYRSEFLNRFNGRQNILCFNRLGLDSIQRIVRREIDQLDESYREQGIETRISDQDLADFCADQYDPAIGARGLPGYIQVNIEPIIVNALLANPDLKGELQVAYDTQAKRFSAQLVEQADEQRPAA